MPYLPVSFISPLLAPRKLEYLVHSCEQSVVSGLEAVWTCEWRECSSLTKHLPFSVPHLCFPSL